MKKVTKEELEDVKTPSLSVKITPVLGLYLHCSSKRGKSSCCFSLVRCMEFLLDLFWFLLIVTLQSTKNDLKALGASEKD
mgnify:CR=1 FL=1